MENDGVQPGQTITPGAASTPPAPANPPAATPDPAPPADPVPPANPAPEPAPEPAPAPAPQTPPETPAPAPVPEETPAEQPPAEEPRFDTMPETDQPDGPKPDVESISWSASEFIDHAKSFNWYATLGLVAAAGAGLIFFIMRDVVSVAVIIIAAIVFGIYAGHKPRELQYKLDFHGLTIGDKHFGYDQFRSFSVLPEGAFSSIVFMPLKRFAVTTTIYYAPEDEDKIVNLLSDYLPLENRGHDAVDRLMHKIHF